VPNWGQEPDKTFDVRLTDGDSDHDIYLTRLIVEPALYSSSSPESARNSLVSRRAEGHVPAAGLLSAALLVGGGLVAVILLSLAVAHVCRSATHSAKPVVVSEKDAVVYDVSRAEVVTAIAGESECFNQHAEDAHGHSSHVLFQLLASLTINEHRAHCCLQSV